MKLKLKKWRPSFWTVAFSVSFYITGPRRRRRRFAGGSWPLVGAAHVDARADHRGQRTKAAPNFASARIAAQPVKKAVAS